MGINQYVIQMLEFSRQTFFKKVINMLKEIHDEMENFTIKHKSILNKSNEILELKITKN